MSKNISPPYQPRPLSIVMESTPLEHDDPQTNLICKTQDGRFHRVKSMPADWIDSIPEGWEVIEAISTFIAGREKAILIEVKK